MHVRDVHIYIFVLLSHLDICVFLRFSDVFERLQSFFVKTYAWNSNASHNGNTRST